MKKHVLGRLRQPNSNLQLYPEQRYMSVIDSPLNKEDEVFVDFILVYSQDKIVDILYYEAHYIKAKKNNIISQYNEIVFSTNYHSKNDLVYDLPESIMSKCAKYWNGIKLVPDDNHHTINNITKSKASNLNIFHPRYTDVYFIDINECASFFEMLDLCINSNNLRNDAKNELILFDKSRNIFKEFELCMFDTIVLNVNEIFELYYGYIPKNIPDWITEWKIKFYNNLEKQFPEEFERIQRMKTNMVINKLTV